MAEHITLARPYARAAFDLADANGKLDAWATALDSAAFATKDAQFAALLGSPHVLPGQLADLLGDVVTQALGGQLGEIDLQAGNLFRVMAENGRLHVLPEVAAMYNDLKSEKENVLDVQLVSATPVGDALQRKFSSALEKRLGRNVRLHCSVDDTLIGGAVIKADDMVIDGSLRGRLAKLASVMTQ